MGKGKQAGKARKPRKQWLQGKFESASTLEEKNQ